ncbi:hypothetical protein WJ61_28455 [Burkholderia ubonensis]|uniref:DUF4377 domain-containing protein n=1 Tax=Burkholderia ubonensis TaxID=101571 RepID=UPI00075E8641|nr:DUF4377 domain-containing protein [Burkholderia ubonensis]KVM66761.1 hypothetical protein WJ61_28455 [Burkholderia ubonensis]KWI61828.1 hypothetical protein WM07_23120 [Burkholderia ubonensis]
MNRPRFKANALAILSCASVLLSACADDYRRPDEPLPQLGTAEWHKNDHNPLTQDYFLPESRNPTTNQIEIGGRVRVSFDDGHFTVLAPCVQLEGTYQEDFGPIHNASNARNAGNLERIDFRLDKVMSLGCPGRDAAIKAREVTIRVGGQPVEIDLAAIFQGAVRVNRDDENSLMVLTASTGQQLSFRRTIKPPLSLRASAIDVASQYVDCKDGKDQDQHHQLWVKTAPDAPWRIWTYIKDFHFHPGTAYRVLVIEQFAGNSGSMTPGTRIWTLQRVLDARAVNASSEGLPRQVDCSARSMDRLPRAFGRY